MSNKQIVYITGSSGFIGSNIIDEFIQNNYLVIGLDRNKSRKKLNGNKFISYQIDIGNRKTLKSIFKKYPPLQIVHHASELVNVGKSIRLPWKAQEDIINTTKLFETALSFGLKHVVFSSSANVYGTNPKTPIEETHPISPASPYGLAKMAVEEYIGYFGKRNNIPYTIFRYFNVFGEGQSYRSTAAIPAFINSLLQKKVITLHGGNQTRDFIYVKDVAKANLLACKKQATGIFNIGMGQEQKIISTLNLISKLMRIKPKINLVKRDAADCSVSVASIKKAEKELQWIPKISFEEGLKKTIEYYIVLLDH